MGAGGFGVSVGWAGTQCAFQVGKSVQFTITRQGGAAVAEEQSKRLMNT